MEFNILHAACKDNVTLSIAALIISSNIVVFRDMDDVATYILLWVCALWLGSSNAVQKLQNEICTFCQQNVKCIHCISGFWELHKSIVIHGNFTLEIFTESVYH